MEFIIPKDLVTAISLQPQLASGNSKVPLSHPFLKPWEDRLKVVAKALKMDPGQVELSVRNGKAYAAVVTGSKAGPEVVWGKAKVSLSDLEASLVYEGKEKNTRVYLGVTVPTGRRTSEIYAIPFVLTEQCKEDIKPLNETAYRRYFNEAWEQEDYSFIGSAFSAFPTKLVDLEPGTYTATEVRYTESFGKQRAELWIPDLKCWVASNSKLQQACEYFDSASDMYVTVENPLTFTTSVVEEYTPQGHPIVPVKIAPRQQVYDFEAA